MFTYKKTEIVKKLVEDWENKSYNYEADKEKYLKSLFNNDINKCFYHLSKQVYCIIDIGYKEFTLVEHELPKSGIMKMYSTEEAIAPFKILTKQNSYIYNNEEPTNDGEHYYIKLIDNVTNDIVAAIFVRANDEIEVQVPVGSYKIKYATGKKWYGEKDLFGHNTSYYKSDKILNFTKNLYYVNGQSLTLYKVSNGNFATETTSAEDF